MTVVTPPTEDVNPFAQDVEAALPGPATLIIFGATGDLSQRKLLPAVYNLASSGRLPQRFRVLGISRRGDRDAFRASARDAVARFSRTELSEESWPSVAERMDFLRGDVSEPDFFRRLSDELDRGDEAMGGPTRRVFYLATAPGLFGKVAEGLGENGLGAGAEPSTGIVIEKPVGHDLPSALELNRTFREAFEESQIFRTDHYLGKETVQNLLMMRFTNTIFEPIWNHRYIDHVQITVAEDLGLGGRAPYYDKAGALRDIVQSHMLQLVSLVGMEAPHSFGADVVRDEKVKLLRSVKPLDVDGVPRSVVRGRYRSGWVGGEQVPGYLDEQDIPAESTTESYVAMRLEIDNWRWARTPFYLRTGKRLSTRATEIAVAFKEVPHLPLLRSDMGGVTPNELVLYIQPNEGASLRFMAKVPGEQMTVRPVQMDFQYGSTFLRESPEAYERILNDSLLGDATLFTRADEVEAAWRIVQPVLEAWSHGHGGLESYEAGSEGPLLADELLARDGRRWRGL